MNQPLLTIAIPTYNRADLLDLCLSQAGPQILQHGEQVELLVSDNASTDHTAEIVAKHQAAGLLIHYLRNNTNIGPDANFAQCLERADGTFLLIVGDDDVLLEGALDKLLPLLCDPEVGVVHIGCHPFRQDFKAERPRRALSGKTQIYTNPPAFAAKVNVMFTFISGNVINKSTLPADFSPQEYVGTNLIQLSWTLTAALGAKRNLLLDEYLVAAKAENTGGYQLCRVFGTNMNAIFRMLEAKGADPECFRVINQKTLTTFFPKWILTLRAKGEKFTSEDHFDTLRPVFKDFPALWLMVWPSAKWPLPLAKLWLKLCRRGLKTLGKW
jgi:glycosyltransferase involved in cell wall biosynthesis